ncbi:MAG: hypothetical protein ABJD07_16650 [Gemmatimonadaceae bacterium]
MRRIAPLVVLAVALAAMAPASSAAQRTSTYRYEISSAGDSTFAFAVGGDSVWIRPGSFGIAVDPRRHDVLIARFRVLGVTSGAATALITGQTTLVTADHVALLERPEMAGPRFFRRPAFWGGLLLGGAAGYVLAHNSH